MESSERKWGPWSVVICCSEDGGPQLVKAEGGEDCCAAARRAGGICQYDRLPLWEARRALRKVASKIATPNSNLYLGK